MFSVIILAAGAGTRMNSQLPKVLHTLAGRPLLSWVVAATQALKPQGIHVVHGHGGEQVREQFAQADIHWVHQAQQLGTGHAVTQALPDIPDDHRVLILAADTPLISSATLTRFLEQTPQDALGIITAQLDDPSGLGRILRDDTGAVTAIVEEKDASDSQRTIKEINSSIMLVPARYLKEWLPQLENHNKQGEYYLTDIVSRAVAQGTPIATQSPQDIHEIQGVNTRVQLSALERHYQQQQAHAWLARGVTIMDPARFDVRGELEIGPDVVVDVNVVFEGQVSLGAHCRIGPNCVLRDVVLGDHVEVRAHSHLEGVQAGSRCIIGPFARLRPGTQLADQVHVGNFVEVKKTQLGEGSKINHLSYVGDAVIGQDVNVGAGTITCNYDGANKHPTVIADNAFIGSGTELVAPINVGRGATIGAGSTVTQDIPEGTLTVARTRQRSIAGWLRPQKHDLED